MPQNVRVASEFVGDEVTSRRNRTPYVVPYDQIRRSKMLIRLSNLASAP
jgi:hypothetical protein